jgi:hypothetical protein
MCVMNEVCMWILVALTGNTSQMIGESFAERNY